MRNIAFHIYVCVAGVSEWRINISSVKAKRKPP